MGARRALRAVPAARRRGIGIIRVSKEGGRGDKLLSPDLQRTSILGHAERHHIDIVEWVEAIDESGYRGKSAWWPTLWRIIEKLEADQADVIVAWKLSRMARHPLNRELAYSRIANAGKEIESATEPIDTSTPAGLFTRDMIGAVDTLYSRQVSAQWKEVHENRVARGLPPGGKVPWGWRWADDGRSITPDPERAPYIVEAYRRYLAGAGTRDLSRWLNAAGVKPMHADVWDNQTITQCLDSPVHAGMVVHRGELHEGAHEGLVDVETWEAYKAERERRAGEREVKRRYLLSGIAMCPCTDEGTPMNGFTITKSSRARGAKPRLFVSYRCTSLGRTPGHGPWSMTARIVEGALMDWLHEIADDVENKIPAAALAADSAHEQAAKLRAERDRIKLALTNLTVQHAMGTYPDDAYEAARDQLTGRRQQIAAELRTLEQHATTVPDDPAGLARQALDDWDERSVEGRRAALRQLVKGVVVDHATHSARVWPVWETQRPW